MPINPEQITADRAGCTPGGWTPLNMVGEDGKPMSPNELGEYVKNAVQRVDEGRFLFVSGSNDGVESVDVCHVGNGPKGPHNARLIAAAPELADFYIAVNAALNRDLHPVEKLDLIAAIARGDG